MVACSYAYAPICTALRINHAVRSALNHVSMNRTMQSHINTTLACYLCITRGSHYQASQAVHKHAMHTQSAQKMRTISFALPAAACDILHLQHPLYRVPCIWTVFNSIGSQKQSNSK